VPKPTADYIDQASQEPQRLATPQRLLIIMDLNGALIHRPKRNEPSKFVGRPFVKPFLEYLLASFSVMVWSSARPENVDKMCSQLFTPEQRRQLVTEWGRDMLGLNAAQYNEKVQVYKQLDKVWDFAKIGHWHPERLDGQLFGQHNTLLIDDSVLKASSEPFNLIQITEFVGQREQMSKDVLGQVVGYLEQAKMQQDVSRFVKRKPFFEDGGW
ncbi:HAD-like protein, partial [Saccharata proteae CBS 121410]